MLRGFSFEVKPGQKVACVGKAGCGKSTSVSLLQRLYDVEEGKILVDGHSIKDYDVRHLRRRCDTHPVQQPYTKTPIFSYPRIAC